MSQSLCDITQNHQDWYLIITQIIVLLILSLADLKYYYGIDSKSNLSYLN